MTKVTMGMVGGGEGAFIGEVHRMAANLDGEIELVCGACISDAERSRRPGEALQQFVAIVTPNRTNFLPTEI